MPELIVGNTYFVKHNGKLQEGLLIRIQEQKEKYSGIVSHLFHFEMPFGDITVSPEFIKRK